MLLTAEQEAQQIISSAKNCKASANHVCRLCKSFLQSYLFIALNCSLAQLFILFNPAVKITRLKQAKEEAEKEVAAYRPHLEAEYQKSMVEVLCAYFVVKELFSSPLIV